MAYYTTTAAQFDPYSLQDLLAPLTMYKSRWDELEKSYEDMDSKAAILEAQASADPKTAQMYAVYKEALMAGRDAMMQGLSNKDTSNLLNAKRAYNSNVLPIAEAVAARTSDSDVWRKQKASDPSLLGDDPMSKPLSGYLYGNRPELHNVSGNQLYTKAFNAAKNISSRYFNTDEGKLFKGAYYNLITEKGFAPELAARTLIESGRFQGLTEFYNNLLASEGVGNLSNADQIRAAEYALSGLDAGFIRDVDMKPLQNPYVTASIGRKTRSGSGDEINSSPINSILSPKNMFTIAGGKYSLEEITKKKQWLNNKLDKTIKDTVKKISWVDDNSRLTGQKLVAPNKELELALKDYNKMFGTNYELVHRTKLGIYQIGWKDNKGKWHYNELDPNDRLIEDYTRGSISSIARPDATESAYDNIGFFMLKNMQGIASGPNGKSTLKDENGKTVSTKDVKNIKNVRFKGVTKEDELGDVVVYIDYSTDGENYKEGTVIPEAFSALNIPYQIDVVDHKDGRAVSITTLDEYMNYVKKLDPYSPESAEALKNISNYIYKISNSAAEGQSQTSAKTRTNIENSPNLNVYSVAEENPYYSN